LFAAAAAAAAGTSPKQNKLRTIVVIQTKRVHAFKRVSYLALTTAASSTTFERPVQIVKHRVPKVDDMTVAESTRRQNQVTQKESSNT
jgi:hypothetical protein